MRFFVLLIASVTLSQTAVAKQTDLCGPGEKVAPQEKVWLLESVRRSEIGQKLLESFKEKFKSFDRLHVYWDDVSYSQLGGRDHAAQVCIRLAKRLPDIEHIADFAHELTHAVRLTTEVLHGHTDSAEEFVNARLGAHGGEADAFATECRVKKDILGRWDELCSPYTTVVKEKTDMDVQRILAALKDGTLSASLTGEPYPVMLTRQFQMLLERRIQRAPASSREK